VHDVELRPNEPFVNYESLWRTEPVREERAARKSGGAIHCPIQHLVESLDPAPQFHLWYSEVQLNIFETLTRVFEGARLVPWLASSVESEEAGERLRIRLRDDVRFHDGRRLTARDVRATFERVLRLRGSLNRWLLSPIRGADEMIRGEADQLEGLRIVNAHELVLELVEPVAGFAAVFAHNSLAIVPEGTTTIGTSWKEGCLGTGPFRATRFEPAKRLDLEANPHYWRPGFPRAESLSFTFGVKPSEIAEKFRSGRYSLAWDLVPEDLVALRRDPELRAQYRETPRLSTYFVVFNCHRGPFSDESLRRRFAAAIDADALVQQHLGRVAIRADGLLPPGLAGHERVSRARGAAEPPASPRLALSLGVSSPYSTYAPFVRGLIDQAAAAGFDVSLDNDRADRLLLEERTSFDLLLARWIADYPDSDNFFNSLFHTKGGMQRLLVGNPALDAMIEAGRREHDPVARHAIYRSLEEYLFDHAIIVPLFHEQAYCLARPEIEGFEVRLFFPTVVFENLSVRR
jgi:ABC-type transport system substrate-binding protein